jgi:hypothetical protein
MPADIRTRPRILRGTRIRTRILLHRAGFRARILLLHRPGFRTRTIFSIVARSLCAWCLSALRRLGPLRCLGARRGTIAAVIAAALLLCTKSSGERSRGDRECSQTSEFHIVSPSFEIGRRHN